MLQQFERGERITRCQQIVQHHPEAALDLASRAEAWITSKDIPHEEIGVDEAGGQPGGIGQAPESADDGFAGNSAGAGSGRSGFAGAEPQDAPEGGLLPEPSPENLTRRRTTPQDFPGRVLDALRDGETSGRALATRLDVAQTTISRVLRDLLAAGQVRRTGGGSQVRFSLASSEPEPEPCVARIDRSETQVTDTVESQKAAGAPLRRPRPPMRQSPDAAAARAELQAHGADAVHLGPELQGKVTRIEAAHAHPGGVVPLSVVIAWLRHQDDAEVEMGKGLWLVNGGETLNAKGLLERANRQRKRRRLLAFTLEK